MITILDINLRNGCIKHSFQLVNSPESFLHLKESFDGDFEVANDESQRQLDKFMELLAFLGWTADEWWHHFTFCKETLKIYAEVNTVVLDFNTWDHINEDICYCSTIEGFRGLQEMFPDRHFELSSDAEKTLKDALEYFMYGGEVKYLKDTMTLKTVEYMPKPVYCGGSMDSVDFDVEVYTYSIEDAWERHRFIQEGERRYNSEPYEEEIELPF